MGITGADNSEQGEDVVMNALKGHPDFLQWDREINGKLYYALWILFMGGFVISIGFTNQPDLFSNCIIRTLLHIFRLSAVIGSGLNFWMQSKAIDAVRNARIISVEMDIYRALKNDNKIETATKHLGHAQELNKKLLAMDGLISLLECTLLVCAAIFLACSLAITWNIVPTASPK